MKIAPSLAVALIAVCASPASQAIGQTAPGPTQFSQVAVCTMTSPASAKDPTFTLGVTKSVDNQGVGKTTTVLQFGRIEAPSAEEPANFPGSTLEVTGLKTWNNLAATGRTVNGAYSLVVPLTVDVSEVLEPLAKGSELKVTLQTAAGPKSYAFKLEGSGKAVSSFRKCLK